MDALGSFTVRVLRTLFVGPILEMAGLLGIRYFQLRRIEEC